MRAGKLVSIAFALLALALPGWGEFDVHLDITSSNYLAHTAEDEVLQTEAGFSYNGILGLELNLYPGFAFEENFQFDSLVDVIFTKNYLEPSVGVDIQELYIDLLFHDVLSVKTGFVKMDYGFQGYFHPLNIMDFLNDFRELYGTIAVGGSDKGFRGVPGAVLKYTFPEFIPGMTLNLSQAVALFDFDLDADYYFENFAKNYSITKLGLGTYDLNLDLLCGWSGYSLADREPAEEEAPPLSKKWPVAGLTATFVLPANILFFWEGMAKFESFRPYIETGALETYREDLFFNTSLRCEWSKSVGRDNLALTGEYFYHGEGLSAGQYDDVIAFLADDPANLQYYYGIDGMEDVVPKLLVPERNFRHYLYTAGDYTFEKHNLSIGYALLTALEQGLFKHSLTVGKSYNDVAILTNLVFVTGDEKYQPVFAARELSLYLNIIVSM